jgi:hypothetical protein
LVSSLAGIETVLMPSLTSMTEPTETLLMMAIEPVTPIPRPAG